jgi:HK97 gp10 family phage protein
MANSLDIKLEPVGIKEVQNALEGVRKSVSARILTNAMRYALKPMLQAAKSNAPTGFGALKKSLISRIKKYTKGRDDAIVVGMVGPEAKFKTTVNDPNGFAGRKQRVEKPSKYAHLVERGAKSHFIPAPGYGKRAQKRNPKILGVGPSPGWQHPGARPHPFLAPTAKTQRSTFIQRFRERVLERVNVEYARAKKGGKRFWSTDV